MAKESQPGYLGALNLATDPFADHAGPEFYYADPQLVQRIDLLHHLTQFSDLLILITGPEGSGRTTLLEQYHRRAGKGWRLCRLTGADLVGEGRMLQALAACFDVSTPDLADFGPALMEACTRRQRKGELFVVTLDDADRCDRQLLVRLLTLGGDLRRTVNCLRILLVGQPTLEQQLRDAGLSDPRSPWLYRMDLPLFDTHQSAAYLMYRLAVAGYSGDSPFSSRQVGNMHRAARGCPGALNRLAREALERRFDPARQQHRLSPGLRRTLWLAGLPIAAAGLALAGYRWLLPAFHMPPPAAGQEASRPLPIEPLPPEEVELPAPASPAAAPRPLAKAATPPTPTPAPAPAVSPPPAAATPAPRPASPSPPPRKPAPALPVKAAPAKPAAPTPARAQPSAPAPGRRAVKATGPKAQPAPRRAATGPRTPQRPGRDWLQHQPPGHFTLQLAVLSHRAAAERLAGQPALRARAHVYRRSQKGRSLYVVLYGSFPDRAAALRARAGLPAPIRRQKPWPRPLRELRGQLRPLPAPRRAN